MANAVNDVRTALARTVAQRDVPDDVLDAVAERIATAKHPIRGIDMCERGICLDFIVESNTWKQTLPDLVEIDGGISK